MVTQSAPAGESAFACVPLYRLTSRLARTVLPVLPLVLRVLDVRRMLLISVLRFGLARTPGAPGLKADREPVTGNASENTTQTECDTLYRYPSMPRHHEALRVALPAI